MGATLPDRGQVQKKPSKLPLPAKPATGRSPFAAVGTSEPSALLLLKDKIQFAPLGIDGSLCRVWSILGKIACPSVSLACGEVDPVS